VGGGEFSLTVQPVRRLTGLEWVERGELPLAGVTGVAAATNLPSHIPQRMVDRARNVLRTAGIASQVQPLRERGPAAGAGIFLVAEYSNGAAGFSAIGRRGGRFLGDWPAGQAGREGGGRGVLCVARPPCRNRRGRGHSPD